MSRKGNVVALRHKAFIGPSPAALPFGLIALSPPMGRADRGIPPRFLRGRDGNKDTSWGIRLSVVYCG